MQVLLIKTSSMGDVLHTLPAVTDAVRAIPTISFDWVVEPGFSEIPSWHPAVQRIIEFPLRRWRKNWRECILQGELIAFIKSLRQKKYDLIIDAQGLLKSAIVGFLARGKSKAGLDQHSIREKPASWFYQQKISVAKDMHAIVRVRQLFAGILNYDLSDFLIDYGLQNNLRQNKNNTEKPYLAFLHGTTWESKHWPDEYWDQLAALVKKKGFQVKVTWATPEQQQRALFLAEKNNNVEVLPTLTLSQAAKWLADADGAVAVDTGFGHLTAAVGTPLVALYGPTDIKKTGAFGPANQVKSLASQFSCAPCFNRICTYQGKINSHIKPACFAELNPEKVWEILEQLINQKISIKTKTI